MDHGGSIARAAESLYVHRNTAAYRLRRAEELLGRSATDRAPETHTALRLATLSPQDRLHAPPLFFRSPANRGKSPTGGRGRPDVRHSRAPAPHERGGWSGRTRSVVSSPLQRSSGASLSVSSSMCRTTRSSGIAPMLPQEMRCWTGTPVVSPRIRSAAASGVRISKAPNSA
ncbi:helix-turn-helix domain-containing protein [Streptomyces sp. NPDC101062]|uniref:helix-turn-helix domain-containing protein n=1 Tax=unclassified Streptomyces TaxID=2593676 RepID=UPI00381CDEA2